jgi:hypothetical protein
MSNEHTLRLAESVQRALAGSATELSELLANREEGSTGRGVG